MRRMVRSYCLGLVLSALSCQSAITNKSVEKGGSVGGSTANAQTGGTSASLSQSLTLTSATAHVDGRRGNRVRLSISGQQSAADFASVAVLALDASGNGLVWFDTNLDGQEDSATGYLVPQDNPNDTSFNFEILAPLPTPLQGWSQAEISLFDRNGAVSNQLSIPVAEQPVRAAGETCDPTAKADRCGQDLECNSGSATCVNHTGPSLDRVVYMDGPEGPILLASGTDNADDVAVMRLQFMDSQGNAVQVNLDNDTTAPTLQSNFTATSQFTPTDGTYLFQVAPVATFSDTVRQVKFVPVDLNAHVGAGVVAPLTQAPSIGSGTTCDAQGFNYCSGNSACVPGVVGAVNTCQPLGSVQSQACKSAPSLGLAPAGSMATGYNKGPSLWEPPAGCAADIALHHPETVFKMHVASETPSITITTERRETRMDTVLYVASVCSPSTTGIIACNDDIASGNVASAVTLTNVAVGDYYVIVDSLKDTGGQFGLAVTTP